MILLFSGGYDSTLLALRYIDEIRVLLHIQYRHPAEAFELRAVEEIAGKLIAANPKISLITLNAPIYAKDMDIGACKQGSRYVPNRNAIFLSLAANIARQHDCDTVIYGASPADQCDYFDCTPPFIQLMAKALRIEVCAPLLDTCDFDVGDTKLLEMSWSCYQPIGEKPCGMCNSCKQRK